MLTTDYFSFLNCAHGIDTTPLNDNGLFFRRHEALLSVAERRLKSADTENHILEASSYRHRERVVGSRPCVVVGHVFFYNARAERNSAKRHREPSERIVAALLWSYCVVGVPVEHIEFLAKRNHCAQIGISDRRRIIRHALQQDYFAIAAFPDGFHSHGYFFQCRSAGRKNDGFSRLPHVREKFQVVYFSRADFVRENVN